MVHRFHLVLMVLALAACGESEAAREPVLQPDPAVVAALAAPIMSDPDLAAMNRGNAAIAVDRFDGIPGWTRDPEEIDAARSEALRLAGGSLLQTPEAGTATPDLPSKDAREFAATLPGISDDCLGALRSGFAWAADLPAAARLYPAGHVIEAAGARRADCAMRSLRYVTAAVPKDALDYHYTMFSAAGYRVEVWAHGEATLLTGSKSGARARILVRANREGMTEVLLATLV
jgi:hypothetical protein